MYFEVVFRLTAFGAVWTGEGGGRGFRHVWLGCLFHVLLGGRFGVKRGMNWVVEFFQIETVRSEIVLEIKK